MIIFERRNHYMEIGSMGQMAKSVGEVISKNSPTILTGIAVAGLVTTTILGIKATPKALSVIDDYVWERYENEVEMGINNSPEISFAEWLGVDMERYSWKDKTNMISRRDTVKLTWKLYLPTIAFGVVTIACIIGANHISLRRNAALASIYGITEAAFKEYQTKVVETLGKGKELKIRDEISGDRVKRNPPGTNEVIFTGKGEVMCYDSLSGRYFKNDIEKIRRAINTLNYDLRSDMFITLNQLYDELGLSNTGLGDQMGWDIDKGEISIDFSTQLTENGEPCLVLNYKVEPKFMR
jgi:hypothetical protein